MFAKVPPKLAVSVAGIALATALMVVTIYHYATRAPGADQE